MGRSKLPIVIDPVDWFFILIPSSVTLFRNPHTCYHILNVHRHLSLQLNTKHNSWKKVNTLLPDDLAARIRDETLSCHIIERLMHQACYLSWATRFPKMFLPAEEFDISYIEQGLVHRFILNRYNLADCQICSHCFSITKRNIPITISSALGERDEFRFYQPYQ